MFETGWVTQICTDLLRERRRELLDEACAWAVGLGDRPHLAWEGGRPRPTGGTLGTRAEAGFYLGVSEGDSLDVGVTAPGTFADALDALALDGGRWADQFEIDVIEPFAASVATEGARRAAAADPAAWAELVDDVDVDPSDPEELAELVRTFEWDVPVRADASETALLALGGFPLAEVEATGLPLSTVRAAEAEARRAAEDGADVPEPATLTGALFLARTVLDARPAPPTPDAAEDLLLDLRTEGLEDEEIIAVLERVELPAGTADAVVRLLVGGS